MHDFSIYVDADQAGRLNAAQQQQLSLIINALPNWRINLLWLIEGKKIGCRQIVNTVRNIHRQCKGKSVIIHSEICHEKKKASLMAKMLLSQLPFELFIDKRTEVEDIVAICFGNEPVGCMYNSCLGNTVYIRKNAELGLCPNAQDIKLHSLEDGEPIEAAFETDSFKEILIAHIQKRENCKSHCGFYSACRGGCPLKTGEIVCSIKTLVEEKHKSISNEDAYRQRISQLSDLYRG